MSRQVLSPRVVVHANGNATLAGVPAHHLFSILTAARLHHYEEQPKTADCPENREWYKWQTYILDEIQRRTDAARRAKYAKPETLKERLRRTTRETAIINRLIEQALAESVSR